MACFSCFSKKKKPHKNNAEQLPQINNIEIPQILQAAQPQLSNASVNQQIPGQFSSFQNLAEFFQYALNHQSSFFTSQSLAPIIENKVKINTVYQIDDIEFIDVIQTHDEKQNYKYYCPICLRYFKQILETICCQNYICHFCAEALNKSFQNQKLIKNNKEFCNIDYPSRCHICNHENLELIDIQSDKEIRIYTDTKFNLSQENNSFIEKNTKKLFMDPEEPEEEKKIDLISTSNIFKNFSKSEIIIRKNQNESNIISHRKEINEEEDSHLSFEDLPSPSLPSEI